MRACTSGTGNSQYPRPTRSRKTMAIWFLPIEGGIERAVSTRYLATVLGRELCRHPRTSPLCEHNTEPGEVRRDQVPAPLKGEQEEDRQQDKRGDDPGSSSGLDPTAPDPQQTEREHPHRDEGPDPEAADHEQDAKAHQRQEPRHHPNVHL